MKNSKSKLTKDKIIKVTSKQYKTKVNELSKLTRVSKQLSVKQKQTGKFKGKLSNNIVKAFTILYPEIGKKELSKTMEISQSTLNKIIAGKKVKLETIKKATRGVNSLTDTKKQLKLTLVSEHLTRYKGISKKKLIEIDKKVKKILKSKNLDLKNKDFLFFKIHYSQQNTISYKSNHVIK